MDVSRAHYKSGQERGIQPRCWYLRGRVPAHPANGARHEPMAMTAAHQRENSRHASGWGELGLRAVVFRPHRVGAVGSFEPADREMAGCDILEVLDEGQVDGSSAECADDRHGL